MSLSIAAFRFQEDAGTDRHLAENQENRRLAEALSGLSADARDEFVWLVSGL